MTTRRPSTTRVRAFSLIELTVVLLLMAILAAVALPRWTTAIEEFRAASMARRIQSDLSLTQRTAILTSSNQTVSFSANGQSYTLTGLSSLDRSAEAFKTTLSDDPYRARWVSIFGGLSDQQLVFNGYGLPNRGGNIVISCGATQRIVQVDVDTGLALLQE